MSEKTIERIKIALALAGFILVAAFAEQVLVLLMWVCYWAGIPM